MHRRSLLTLALAGAATLAFGVSGPAAAESDYRISGPHVHANLAIYFVHGPSAAGPVPLTLQEAVARGVVTVHETGQVNELAIENLGGEEVFVQSGDIVKGGKQDRALMVSLVLPPRSGRVAISSFCVEQGRWSARGREDATRFSSADTALPSLAAKMAMKAPMRDASARTTGPSPMRQMVQPDLHIRPQGVNPRPQRSETGERQSAMWRSVAEAQYRLSSNVGAPVAAPQSATSLQLSLENEKLKEMQAAYISALKAAGEKHDDIVGYVFAINGKLNSADVYASNGLFRKMWTKLLNASVTEAIGERNGPTGELPAAEAVMAFLRAGDSGEAEQRQLTATVKLETREAETTLAFATHRTAGGGLVHKNYLAK